MIEISFKANLNGALEKDARYLPLTTADNAKLLEALPVEQFTYLTIEGPHYSEIVQATNQCGIILLTRGGDTHKFSAGSCVKFENSIAVTKWLICNYDCCATPCPCDPVAYAGHALPAAHVGTPWTGSIMFSGTLPMTCAGDGPDWATVIVGPNFVEFSGTPTVAGQTAVSASATNCSGTLVNKTLAVQVSG